jgi:hypothetical protein
MRASFLFLAAALVSCADADGVARTTQPIVGGAAAPTATGIVFVTTDYGGYVETCSGALIASNLVAINRSCVTKEPAGKIECSTIFVAPEAVANVRVATGDVVTSTTTKLAVKEIVVDPAHSTFCDGNIALLLLEQKIEGTELHAPRLDTPPSKDELFLSIGYGTTAGMTKDGVGTRRAKENLKVLCVGNGCMPSTLISNDTWTGEPGGCTGDGPAIAASDRRLIGLLSWGDANCTEFAVHHRIDGHADWLRTEGKRAAMLGGYAAPSWTEKAMVPADGGTTTEPDAGSPGDGAVNPVATPGGNDSGGCHTAPAKHDRALPFLALFALVFARRRNK